MGSEGDNLDEDKYSGLLISKIGFEKRPFSRELMSLLAWGLGLGLIFASFSIINNHKVLCSLTNTCSTNQKDLEDESSLSLKMSQILTKQDSLRTIFTEKIDSIQRLGNNVLQNTSKLLALKISVGPPTRDKKAHSPPTSSDLNVPNFGEKPKHEVASTSDQTP